MTYAVQHPATTAATWFRSTGVPGYDIDGLVRRLLDEADARNNEDFTDVVHGIRVHGVVRAYELGLGRYNSIDDFAASCNKLTDWADSKTSSLADLHEARQLASYTLRLRFLPRIGKDEFDQYVADNKVKEVGHDANMEEWDRAAAVTGEGIFTDSMGPCITVGFTALSADGTVRYNVILHSFKDGYGGRILDKLQARFDGSNVPAYKTLTKVQYFMVGGSPDPHSRRKASQVLTELRDRKLTVLGIALTTDDVYLHKTKAVMVTAAGEVRWMYY